MRYLVLLALVLFPYAAEAAILINEVAWMGNSVSANDEWIELYNNGGVSVSLDGWTLSDGMSLEIKLAGTVGAGQYAVLERTDDNSAAGTAFLIYTGALTNTGATLKLKRADSSLEDQVAGGEDWENIGGDNTTKETAQLTTSGWVTGTPTPGAKNVTTGSVHEDDDKDTDDDSSSSGGVVAARKSAKTVPLELPDADLKLTVESPTLGYVHQPIQFTVEASGVVDAVRESLQYEWNFGDLGTANGKESGHVYEYPGTYVVSVRGAFAYHEQVARTEITIVPVAFSLTRNRDGDVQISNDAQYEIDISGYTLTGTKSVTLPPRTVLLPNSTITVPRERLERSVPSMVALYDTEVTMVSSWYPSQLRTRDVVVEETAGATEVTSVTSVAPVPRITPIAARTSETNSFVFASEIEPSPVVAYTAPSTTLFMEGERDTGAGLVAAAAATNPAPLRDSWPYFALIGLISVSIVSLYVRKKDDGNQTAQNIVLFDDHD